MRRRKLSKRRKVKIWKETNRVPDNTKVKRETSRMRKLSKRRKAKIWKEANRVPDYSKVRGKR